MTAGLPGMGLSGLFTLLAALVLPLRKALSRRRLFRSSHRAQVGLAGLVAVASVVSWALIGAAAGPAGGTRGTVRGVPVLALSLGLMVLVVAVPATVAAVARTRGRPD